MDVRIYVKTGCPYSARAKRLLEERGIAYEEVNVTDEPGRRQEMIRLAGGRSTTPQVFFGERLVGGYDDLEELDRTRGLRLALSDGQPTA